MASQDKKRDRISYILYIYYLLMLVLGVLLGAHFLYIKLFWKADPEIAARLTQPVEKRKIEPVRGEILASDGRPLAMSFPRYQIYIDCCANKQAYYNSPKKDSLVADWKSRAAAFAEGLAKVQTDGHGAEYYRAKLYKGFESGSRYMRLGRPMEKEQYEQLLTYPLACESRSRGGVWAEKVPTRRYPYGSLARRTIGSVTENDDVSAYSGIDGKFNYVLHGSEGSFFVKKTDHGYTRDYDSSYVAAVDGDDVRTTLNIDYQGIADRILRQYITPEQDLEAACFVLMETKTGAIRSMVNLQRAGAKMDGDFGEYANVAVTRLGEPGSVFKITTLMTCMEDGIVKDIFDTVPGKDGLVQVDGYQKRYPPDRHLMDWTRVNHSTNIPLWYCVQVSSNNAFRYLAIENYRTKPEEFIARLHSYNLGKAFDFDVYESIPSPTIRHPKDRGWSPTDLGQIAMGYGVNITPMHILCFYNAIALGGKMMKPYLVEDIERDGKVIKRFGPSVLNSSICSEETAAKLTQALEGVTTMGTEAGRATAWRLSYIADKCKVAGKTGTADVFTDGKYVRSDGSRKQQGTFVGFFPAEDPQYSVICVVYSKPSRKEFAGGVIPVSVVRDFIKAIYNINPIWNETVETT